jgi:hypothetical protein
VCLPVNFVALSDVAARIFSGWGGMGVAPGSAGAKFFCRAFFLKKATAFLLLLFGAA